MKIEQSINEIVEDLELFDDIMQKYEYIIDLGKSLPSMNNKYKIDKYLVQGCQSKVWLHVEVKENRLHVEADGDALIVKGLVKILIQIYSKQTKEDILATSLKDLEPLGFSEFISQGRQNGLASMLKLIYKHAQEMPDV